MKKKMLCTMLGLLLLGSCAVMTACGSDTDTAAPEETTQVTEETVHAADPLTEEEQQNDDSEGCIEDSEDLLY